jgi:hypothetical protein
MICSGFSGGIFSKTFTIAQAISLRVITLNPKKSHVMISESEKAGTTFLVRLLAS